jgi:probable phosphoglycerate mutase
MMWMDKTLPSVYIARHGETTWSLTGQHTGRTDLPLTDAGEGNSRLLGERLQGLHFDTVLTSPSKRARRTCDLAGFGAIAQVEKDLAEWDYGDYEGLRTSEIRRLLPDWQLFRDGCPDGESVQQISERADRVVQRLRRESGDTLVFSSGHILRVIAARWLGLDASAGRFLMLSTASLSALGYDRSRSAPVVLNWNSTEHLRR